MLRNLPLRQTPKRSAQAKKSNDSGNHAAKRQENGNSQRTKQHICKSHKPTHIQNLQKSCFLADAHRQTELKL